MRRKVKPRRSQPGDEATGSLPRVQDDGERTVEPSDAPDRSAIEETQQVGPVETGQTARTSIERADERKVGSIEAVAQAEPADGISGFVEPANSDPAEGQMPPHFDED